MIFLFIISIGFIFPFGNISDDITGCGGFIKADVKEFLYNKLFAYLTFPDGTVNYVTEILPNGAYSVPIYDFGTYIIKIVGPNGWSIEPVNGYQFIINNHETCVDDYNFQFTGFSISGKVSTANIDHGPSGIFIDLIYNSSIVAQTSTTDGGSFIISKIMPGNYSLHFKSETADGKSLELNDTNYNFEVKNENVVIQESFIIHGYPVFGDITFYEEPVKGVNFFVFSKSINIHNLNFSKYKCLKFDKEDLNIEGHNALCKTVSNSKGAFLFPLLPGGHYVMVPIYKSNISIYDIYPHHYEFEIASSSIDLRSLFRIIGFSVIGKVITSDNISISEAEIYVDGSFLAKSDLYGNFSIKGVKRGNHEISILLNGYLFNRTTVHFDPKNPVIGPFYPEKLSICGYVVIGNTKLSRNEENKSPTRRKILLMKDSDEIVDSVYTQLQDNENINGVYKEKDNFISTFCFYVKPGFYIVKPVSDPIVSIHSLAPNQIKITLKSSPVTVKFSPFRGSISGIVKCIEICNAGEFEVTLKSRYDNRELVQLTQHISISNELSNQGHFQFKDVVPGNYEIELISANSQLPLDRNRWCWSKTVLSADIIDKNIDELLFEQIGFSIPIYSSHNVKIDYFHLSSPNILVGSKEILKGISKVCLPDPGKYKILVTTCHKLSNQSYNIDLNQLCEKFFDFYDPKCHIKIDVIEFLVEVTFELLEINSLINNKELIADVKGMIKFDTDLVAKDITWNNTEGHLSFWIKPDVPIQIFVDSSKYLVKPETLDFLLSKDSSECITNIGKFKLEAGTFINGRVLPALKEVSIEVKKQVSLLDENDIEPIVAVSETNENGEFSIGPLNSSFVYELKLFKNGYKIVQDMISEHRYQFSAYKLAELVVKVVDNVTGNVLSGILLSIIGDDIRKNELTNENGEYVFVGLTPGIYYLRAMMKELEFIPYGAIEVKIIEGILEKILIKAIRTSFSLHGKVVSLNGEPESGVIIEGHPIKDVTETNIQLNCKKHLVRNEYATTDEIGTFRIRGLQPGCHYKIILKYSNTNEENTIIRSYPNNINIKMQNNDIHNIKIYALRNINMKEISAMVRTNEDIYQDSLHIMVFPSDNPDNVIAAHKFISEGIYFRMNLPHNQKKVEYVVRLQSNLNPNLYSNISAQEQILKIEAGNIKSIYKHFEFQFYPFKKSIADSDIVMTLSSSLMLPFLILIMLTFVFKKNALDNLLFKFSKLTKALCCNVGALKHTNIPVTSSSGIKSNFLDAIELTELNNVVAKPNSSTVLQPIKKVPFWSRPKKV